MSASVPDAAFSLTGGGVELGPELPIPVYHCLERWHPERIGALALYCSDGRWGEAFDEFCHKHLGLPRYDRWAVPGGPAALVPGGDPGMVRAAHAQIGLLVHVHELRRIVLITHFGCAVYAQRLQRPPRECLPLQTEDVRTAATTLRDWYPGIVVDAYLAMRNESWLSFHELKV